MADEDIRISFGADTGQVNSAINEVKDGVQSLKPAADDAKSSFDDLKDTLIAAFSVEVIKSFVESMAQLGTQIERMEVQFNMSGQQVQEWRGAMQATGGEVGNFSTAMTRLQVNIDSAIEAPGRQRDAFQKLGITVGQLRSNYGDLNATTLLIADGFQKLHENGGGIPQLVVEMGRGAAGLAPLFAGGAAAVKELLDQFKEFAISDTIVGQLEKIHLQLTVMQAAFTQSGAVLVSDFKPALDALISGLTDLAKSFTDAITNNDALSGSIKILAGVFDGLKITLVTIVDIVRALGDGLLIIFDIMSSNTVTAQKHIEDIKKSFDDWNGSVEKTTKSIGDLITVHEKLSNSSAGPRGATPGGAPDSTDAAGGKNHTSLEKQNIADKLALQEAYYEQKKAFAANDLAAGKITKQQEFAEELQFLADKHAAEENALSQELVLYDKGTKEYQKALDEKSVLDVKYNTQVAQIQAKAALDSQKEWQDSFKNINQAATGMVQGILQGTQTWQQGVSKIFTDIAAKFVENTALPMLEKWVATQLGMTSAQVAADATRTASTTAAAAAGAAASSVASTAQIGKSAAVAAANVYASVSAIPYVGWLLAPPAAAAAFAAVKVFGSDIASFAVGSYSVPGDMPANVHAGEMIIPQTFADSIRSGEATLGQGGGDHYTVSISAVDSQSFANLVNSNPGVIVSAVQKSVRNANPQATSMMRS